MWPVGVQKWNKSQRIPYFGEGKPKRPSSARAARLDAPQTSSWSDSTLATRPTPQIGLRPWPAKPSSINCCNQPHRRNKKTGFLSEKYSIQIHENGSAIDLHRDKIKTRVYEGLYCLRWKNLEQRKRCSFHGWVGNDDVDHVEGHRITAVGSGHGFFGKHRSKGSQIDFLVVNVSL